MMNIGFDAKRAFFNRSGLGNYSRSTLRLLSQYHPENNYFMFTAKVNYEIFQPSANLQLVTPENRLYQSASGLWRSWGINRQIQDHKINIYHGLSNELPAGIQKTGVKTVVTIHDLIFLRYPEYYPYIDRKVYLLKFSYACKVADKIIAASEATKADICHYFGTDPAKIEVVYQTCNPVFRKQVPTIEKEQVIKKYDLPQRFILYLGTIERRKNALTLVKAYLKRNLHIPLVIAGRPTEYMIEINDYLRNQQAGERVIFRHNIETADLPALYQSAHLFVYPSVFEGFGIPILEALYSGVPVITSTGSCFAETGGDAALYCDPYNDEQLSELMNHVLNDPAARTAMIDKGFKYATHFDEEKVASNLMRVYTSL